MMEQQYWNLGQSLLLQLCICKCVVTQHGAYNTEYPPYT